MKTVGIVCEYNPFHTGHLYHFRQIRKDLGEDTAIVCVMSGNYVQRGTPALLDKYTRAKMALLCGADLVLELPYPFSSSGAGYFADAAVSILDRIHVIDLLSFGTETEDLSSLVELSNIASSREREQKLKSLLSDPANASKGYAELRANAYFDGNAPCGPNDTLAIEYIRSLNKRQSSITTHNTVRSCPHLGHSDGTYASASVIRTLCLQGNINEALAYIPSSAQEVFAHSVSNAIARRTVAFEASLLSHLRLAPPCSSIFELPEELRQRLIKYSLRCASYDDLVRSVRTARYTTSRVQRALLHAFLGTTSAHMSVEPQYTQVLATNTVGMALLKRIKKSADIDIMTKPADSQKLCVVAQEQHAHCARADSVYPIFCSDSMGGDIFLRSTPYCDT